MIVFGGTAQKYRGAKPQPKHLPLQISAEVPGIHLGKIQPHLVDLKLYLPIRKHGKLFPIIMVPKWAELTNQSDYWLDKKYIILRFACLQDLQSVQ